MERRGTLIVDHQNLIGQTKNLGLNNFDPEWLVNIALRIANCEALVLVTDLAMHNPITNIKYLYEMERWSNAGFSIMHIPSRCVRLTQNESEPVSSESNGNGNRYKRKDLTDGGIRNELRRWCAVPHLTDILLFTHDVDFAQDLHWVTAATDKKAVLLHMGTENMAQVLREAADEHVNVMENLAAYSVTALCNRHFWHVKQDLETLGQIAWKLIADDKKPTRNRPAIRQLMDAQDLVRHVVLDLLCVSAKSMPCSQRLSWRMLQDELVTYLAHEKSDAGRANQKDGSEQLVPNQHQACMNGVDRIMKIWQANQVLLYDVVDHPICGSHRQFYLNLDHPAVTLLMETDFT